MAIVSEDMQRGAQGSSSSSGAYDPAAFRGLTFSDAAVRFRSGGDDPRQYLERCLETIAAREPIVKAWVVLNERGEIASATTSNIFWVKDGTVHTPNLSSGALAGITRECVIDIATKHFIPLLEGVYEMADLTDADEIFLTSSGLGVAPVTTFDFRRYAVEAGSVTAVIAQAFANLTRS